MEILNPLVASAKEFAEKKHFGQIKPFGKMAYILHPEGVFKRIKLFSDDPILLAACFLHDTVEDSDTTYEELEKNFGVEVANIVKEVTNDPILKEQMGKAPYLVSIMNKMSDNALCIKFGDRLDNLSNIERTDLPFFYEYLKETKFIVSQLNRSYNAVQKGLLGLLEKEFAKLKTN